VKKLLFIFVVFGIAACQQNNFTPVIDEDILVKVVVDLHIAEVSLKKTSGFEKDSLLVVYKDQIIERHKLNLDDLEKDLVDMKSHPEYFQKFYDKVVQTLEELEKPPELEEKDTIDNNDKRK
jgi:hypothetical protein